MQACKLCEHTHPLLVLIAAAAIHAHRVSRARMSYLRPRRGGEELLLELLPLPLPLLRLRLLLLVLRLVLLPLLRLRLLELALRLRLLLGLRPRRGGERRAGACQDRHADTQTQKHTHRRRVM
jgi:hypothetical protein